ncbi:MAG: nucleotidyltransferase family protein [Desulfotomaculales bacterium]
MPDAVVLAGSPNNGQLQVCSPAPYEALIPIGTRFMVEYVVDALLASPRIGKVVVVGPADPLAHVFSSSRVKIVPPGGKLLENFQRGLTALPGARRVLVAAADIPLLTREAVEDFLDRCRDGAVDLYYPVVDKKTVQSRYAGVKRTYVRLREGVFTGGNIFLVNPEIFSACVEKGERLVEARKNPLLLARLLGLAFFLKFLTGRLSLREVEAKVSGLLGINGAAVVSSFPEVGIDVDKPVDLQLACQVLQA